MNMRWLDYCEHCGTTSEPIRKVNAKVVIDGNIQADCKDDRTMAANVEEEIWVCSECGKTINIREG